MKIVELLEAIPEMGSSSIGIFNSIDEKLKVMNNTLDLMLFMTNVNYQVPRAMQRRRAQRNSMNFNRYHVVRTRSNFI